MSADVLTRDMHAQLNAALDGLPEDATPREASRHRTLIAAARNHLVELETLLSLAQGHPIKCHPTARRMQRVSALAIGECRRELLTNGLRLPHGVSEERIAEFLEVQDEADEALIAAETHAMFAVMHLGRARNLIDKAIGA